MSNSDLESVLINISEKQKQIPCIKNVLLAQNGNVFTYPSCDAGEIKNIKNSNIMKSIIQAMVLTNSHKNLSLSDIKNIHKKLDDSYSGEFRILGENVKLQSPGSVQKVSLFPTGLELGVFKLDINYITWLNKSELKPIKLAALAHIKLVMLHPFNNGNGRVAHLLMNFILLKFGYPFIMITKKEDAEEYLNLLQQINEIGYLNILKLDFDDKILDSFYMLICRLIEQSLDAEIINFKNSLDT